MSEPITDPESIHRALSENRLSPNGPLRNARAEELVGVAESSGDSWTLTTALFELISAYNFSSEYERMFVPFARLLRSWDEHPEEFDEYQSHQLHWDFKWMTSRMLAHPNIPLASIEHWLGEMRRRYLLAGHSARPVHQGDYLVAQHIGDTARAEQSFAAWRTAERDALADCEACELNGQGDWLRDLGRDTEALDTWAPVLDGDLSCAEEPHWVLAESLLPLVRIGRPDVARANHLRGHRLARGDESLLGAIGLHLEFCALTGNEARGLEILAEHAAHLGGYRQPHSRRPFFEGACVLLRRLVETGHGARPAARVAGEEHTAAELLERLAAEVEDSVRAFDLRNGNTAVSERSRERLERQPLVGRLPLGTRGALPVVRVAAPAAPAEVPVEAAVETGVEASAKERPPVDVEAAVLAASAQLELGDLKTAEEIARTALSAAGRPADPADAARLHLLLSQVALREDSVEEAAELALEAAHHYDAAPGRTLDAATTRLTLAQLLARLGRDAEAATVLESALPDLLGLPDVDPDLLGEARRLLGESLERIGEHRAAAEQYLRAAELAEQHRSPGAQAWFAGSAGQALQQAGLSAEADRAYARSEELWRELGEPIRLVRATRSRAWISEDIERVRALMARAARELAEAVAAVPAGPHAEDSADARRLLVLRGELAETADQTARLLMRAAAGGTGPAEEALGFAEHAASGFAELGEQVFLDRMQAELLAAWIEADLGRPDAAEQRLRAAIGHCAERGPEDQVAAGQLDQLREALEQIAGAADGG